jgi:hypothetical protein
MSYELWGLYRHNLELITNNLFKGYLPKKNYLQN